MDHADHASLLFFSYFILYRHPLIIESCVWHLLYLLYAISIIMFYLSSRLNNFIGFIWIMKRNIKRMLIDILVFNLFYFYIFVPTALYLINK